MRPAAMHPDTAALLETCWEPARRSARAAAVQAHLDRCDRCQARGEAMLARLVRFEAVALAARSPRRTAWSNPAGVRRLLAETLFHLANRMVHGLPGEVSFLSATETVDFWDFHDRALWLLEGEPREALAEALDPAEREALLGRVRALPLAFRGRLKARANALLGVLEPAMAMDSLEGCTASLLAECQVAVGLAWKGQQAFTRLRSTARRGDVRDYAALNAACVLRSCWDEQDAAASAFGAVAREGRTPRVAGLARLNLAALMAEREDRGGFDEALAAAQTVPYGIRRQARAQLAGDAAVSRMSRGLQARWRRLWRPDGQASRPRSRGGDRC